MANLPTMMRGAVSRVAASLTREQQRALPSSKGEVPVNQLQNARTEIYTAFTVVGGTHLLYSGENSVYMTLVLEDAGPVDIGTSATLTPVLSGKGATLTTDIPVRFAVEKGTRVYITAETVNRVKVFIEPVPLLAQIDASINRSIGAIGAAAAAIVGAIAALRTGVVAATSSSGRTAAEIGTPPGSRTPLPRLTPMSSARKIR